MGRSKSRSSRTITGSSTVRRDLASARDDRGGALRLVRLRREVGYDAGLRVGESADELGVDGVVEGSVFRAGDSEVLAVPLACVGRTEGAPAALERALAARYPFVGAFREHPILESARADARFLAAARKVRR